MKATESAPLRKWTEELSLAIGLLTRFPLPAFEKRTEATIGSAFWAYPLAGGLIGVSSAAAFWLSITAGFTTLVAALLAMATSILLSGGFHEDGLSDFWDGLGGGHSREDKLAIMRDSRIGAYGVLALLFTLGLQIAFLVNLHHYAGLAKVAAGLVAAEITARGAIALPVALLDSARQDGLGQSLMSLRRETLLVAVLIATTIPALLLGLPGLILAAGAAVGAAFVTLLAGHFLEGFTGDVLGATAATARMVGLGVLVLLMTP